MTSLPMYPGFVLANTCFHLFLRTRFAVSKVKELNKKYLELSFIEVIVSRIPQVSQQQKNYPPLLYPE